MNQIYIDIYVLKNNVNIAKTNKTQNITKTLTKTETKSENLDIIVSQWY